MGHTKYWMHVLCGVHTHDPTSGDVTSSVFFVEAHFLLQSWKKGREFILEPSVTIPWEPRFRFPQYHAPPRTWLCEILLVTEPERPKCFTKCTGCSHRQVVTAKPGCSATGFRQQLRTLLAYRSMKTSGLLRIHCNIFEDHRILGQAQVQAMV